MWEIKGPTLSKFGPKEKNSPSIGKECPACSEKLIAGDYTTLIVLGPGDNKEEQAKAANGKSYNAVAAEVHWACATGEIINKEMKDA